MQNFKVFLFILTKYERKRASLLLILILIMALLDMVGVASILPFMTVLSNPDIVETNTILNTMFRVSGLLGVNTYNEFVFALGVIVFVLLVITLTFKGVTTYAQVRFVQMREYSIGKRLISGYLYQPYTWFLFRHSADLGKTILSEVQLIVGAGLRQLIELIAKSLVAILIISLLIIIDPRLALIVGFSLGGAYLAIFYFVRKFVKNIGEKRLIHNQIRFTKVSESFGAIKEIKIGGLEESYIKGFSRSAKIYASTSALAQIFSQLPRFILEAIAFGGVLLIILYVMSQEENFNKALPIISLYVFAGYRLLPALQQIYAALTSITYVTPALDKLQNDLKNLKQFNENKEKKIINFNKKIELKNISYHYPNSSRIVLNNINLKIPAKSTVGFVGKSGSGKTTTIDVILGLLIPQKGTLEVDGTVITEENSKSWQRYIGYVPQHIFLSDDTIAANIAFGIEHKDIRQDWVERASKIANLHDFVMDELPIQYNSVIGEQGVRLSGGQRQRIGIARALYNSPQVLILDEATSALDNNTEKVVMDAVNNLKNNITIILIAHRLNSLKNCDTIFKLDKGLLVE